MAEEKDQEFVEYLVRALVDHPEDVKTERTVDEMGVLITLYLHPEDMGQVIGKGGRVANAMRVLLRVVSAREGKQIELEVVDPN